MRNPLNSIISQCKIQEQNIRDLKAVIHSLEIKNDSLVGIIKKMDESNNI